MGTSFRPYEPDQALLLPPVLSEWLSEDHLAYFVSDTVDQLDLSAFYERYDGDGRRRQPYEPRMMVKLLIYAYATGVFSSRRIARRLEVDVAFRVLAAGNFPAHRTICEFRLQHLQEFQDLFVRLVQLAQELGLIKLGTLAIDGSKLKANASKHKAMSYGRMKEEEQRLAREIAALTARASAEDAEEDARYGADRRGDEIPAELARRQTRLEQIREAKQRLEQRQQAEDRARGREPGDDQRRGGPGTKRFGRACGVPEDRKQENFTDPDSRIMKSGGGFEQCYNAQIAVDGESQLIVASDVCQVISDAPHLLPMYDAAKRNVKLKPRRVLADAGYRSEAGLRGLERRRVRGYVALGREGRASRRVLGQDLQATRRMERNLKSERGKRWYRKRKWMVEPPFGWIKSVLGFRQFGLRGQGKVRGEWSLVCLGMNLRRMATQVSWC